jgi:hypothetical protein
MTRMTFLKFVHSASRTDDPFGDFIGDAQDDRKMPDAKSWAELESYLSGQGACDGAIEAGRLVWETFTAQRNWMGTARRFGRTEEEVEDE